MFATFVVTLLDCQDAKLTHYEKVTDWADHIEGSMLTSVEVIETKGFSKVMKFYAALATFSLGWYAMLMLAM